MADMQDQSSFDDDASTPDAQRSVVELLEADHDEVRLMFEDYESMMYDDAPEADREELARDICMALTVHAALEEEIVYPVAREVLDEPRLVDEATIEHASAKALIAQIESMSAADALFDARVTVLGEYVKHHIREEEDELLPRLAESDADLMAMAERLIEHKQELLAYLAPDIP